MPNSIKVRNKKVEENIGLVGAVLRGFRHPTMSKDEMYQAGCMGLIEAAEKYTGNTGVMFSTYATLNIRNHILKAIEHWNRYYRDMDTSDRVKDMGYEPKAAYGVENEIIDKFTDTAMTNLQNAVDDNTITHFEKELIKMRCGIGYYKRPASLSTISAICKLSRKRVSDILRESFSKVRKRTKKPPMLKAQRSSRNPRSSKHF